MFATTVSLCDEKLPTWNKLQCTWRTFGLSKEVPLQLLPVTLMVVHCHCQSTSLMAKWYPYSPSTCWSRVSSLIAQQQCEELDRLYDFGSEEKYGQNCWPTCQFQYCLWNLISIWAPFHTYSPSPVQVSGWWLCLRSLAEIREEISAKFQVAFTSIMKSSRNCQAQFFGNVDIEPSLPQSNRQTLIKYASKHTSTYLPKSMLEAQAIQDACSKAQLF